MIRNYSGPVRGRATNNTGEIQAATWAINEAPDLGIDELRIYTDSKFLIDSATDWIYRWKRNDWYRMNGERLANRRDFIELYRAMNYNMNIDFEYVPAHSGDPYNDLADQYAKYGASEYARMRDFD